MLVLVIALQLPGLATAWAAQPGIGVVAEGTMDGRGRLIVGPVATPAPPRSFSVTVDGKPVPISAEPVMSDRLAMALVVDASAGGGPDLQAGLSGVVDFALATSPSTRTTLVADTSPPAVVTPLRTGPSTVLRGLDSIEPRGDRQTAAALQLAVQQLPREAYNPRLVVLYTAASDVAGQAADDLVARLTSDGVVLAVVTTAGDGGSVPPYWSAVTAASGGVAVSARASGAVDAFARLAAALRSSYLLTLPAPDRLPAPAVVHVATPNGTLTADTVIRAQAPPAEAGTGADPVVILPVVLAGIVLLLGVVVIVRHRHRARPGARADTPPELAAAALAPVEPDGDQPGVDREQLLAAIGRTLGAGRPVVVQPADGRAGVGVTTVMMEFAQRNHDAYDIAWSIAAQDPPLIGDQVAELAQALGLTAPTDTPQQALAALHDALRSRGRWLLVFDHAEVLRDLARFLPPSTGHVLVGSADTELQDFAMPVTVPPFTRAESVQLLQARRAGLTADDADRLAAALDDLPVTIDMVGSTLADTGIDADTYLGLVAEHDDDASSAPWAVGFDLLGADDPQALALLTLIAWLGPEPVPLTLLTEHADRLPAVLAGAAQVPSQLAERAATLGRRALAAVDPDSVQLHRVPASQLTRRTIDDRPAGEGWPTWAVRLLRAAVPPDPSDPEGWPRWRQLMPHVLAATDPQRPLDDVALEVGWLLNRAAGFLQARGEPESALALLEDSHDIYRRRLGPNHPETVASARTLADNRHALSRGP